MYFKVAQEGAKLAIPMDQIAYTGLFLLGRVLKWFKLYLIEIQANRIITINQKVRFMFLN